MSQPSQPRRAGPGRPEPSRAKAAWSPPPPKRWSRRGKPKYGFWNYPRKQFRGIRRWLPSFRFLFFTGLTLAALVVGGLVVAYNLLELPRPDQMVSAQTTKVFYNDGETLMGEFADQNREIIDVAKLPAHVRDAVVAAEDRTFWDNAGVDPVALARAFVNNLRGGAKQGGSTITQQYIERYLVGKTTTDIPGKLKEALLAVKATRSKDKMEILGAYMNTIYFGRGAYGIRRRRKAISASMPPS